MENHKKILAACALKQDVSIHEFRDGYIKMTADIKIDTDFLMNLHKILLEATGKEWKIDSSHGALGETIAAKERAAEEEYKRNISEYPLVKAILAEFKGAKIETLEPANLTMKIRRVRKMTIRRKTKSFLMRSNK